MATIHIYVRGQASGSNQDVQKLAASVEALKPFLEEGACRAYVELDPVVDEPEPEAKTRKRNVLR